MQDLLRTQDIHFWPLWEVFLKMFLSEQDLQTLTGMDW